MFLLDILSANEPLDSNPPVTPAGVLHCGSSLSMRPSPLSSIPLSHISTQKLKLKHSVSLQSIHPSPSSSIPLSHISIVHSLLV